jgi:hypothetical protein
MLDNEDSTVVCKDKINCFSKSRRENIKKNSKPDLENCSKTEKVN